MFSVFRGFSMTSKRDKTKHYFNVSDTTLLQTNLTVLVVILVSFSANDTTKLRHRKSTYSLTEESGCVHLGSTTCLLC